MKGKSIAVGLLVGALVVPVTMGTTSIIENNITEYNTLTNQERAMTGYNVVDVDMSYGGASMIVNQNGQDHIYVWGRNGNGQVGDGQTGDGSASRYRPIDVTPDEWLYNGWTVKDLVSSEMTTSAIVNDGEKDRLFSWGRNGDGELGLGVFGGNYSTPQEVALPAPEVEVDGEIEVREIKSIEAVSANAYTSFVVVSDGETSHLYTTGSENIGSLGGGSTEVIGGQNKRNWYEEVQLLDASGVPITYNWEFVSMYSEYSRSVGMMINEITPEGEKIPHIFGWGKNATYGQLGHLNADGTPNKNNVGQPKEIDLSVSDVQGDIVQWNGGATNGGVLTEEVIGREVVQRLYIWGDNHQGAFGIGEEAVTPDTDAARQLPPTLVASTEEYENITIENFDFGWETTYVVVNDGERDRLFAAGEVDKGQLGNVWGVEEPTPVANEYVSEWTEIDTTILNGGEIVQIASDDSTPAILVNDGGKIVPYIWGYNGLGQVGNGTNKNVYDMTEVFFPKNETFDETSMSNIAVSSVDIAGNTFDMTFDLTGKTGEEIVESKTYSNYGPTTTQFYAERTGEPTSYNDVSIDPVTFTSEIAHDEDGFAYREFKTSGSIENIPFGIYENVYISHNTNSSLVKVNSKPLGVSFDNEIVDPVFELESYNDKKGEVKVTFEILDSFNIYDPSKTKVKVERSKGYGSEVFVPQISIVEEQGTKNQASVNVLPRVMELTISGITNDYSYNNWQISVSGNEEDFIRVDIVDSDSGAIWYPEVKDGISVETLIWFMIILVLIILIIQATSSIALYTMVRANSKHEIEEVEKLQFAALTRKAIMELLDEAKIEFDRTAPKEALVELIWKHDKEKEEAFDEDDYEHWKDFDFIVLTKEELVDWLTEHKVEFDEKASQKKLAEIANHFYHET